MPAVQQSGIRYKPRARTVGIILHDSHTTDSELSIGDVPRWADAARELGRKMGYLDIGYNFIVERDGTAVETRDRRLIGSHTPGLNMETIGICWVGGRVLAGGLAVDNRTDDQKDTLLRLCHELRIQFTEDGTVPWVKGHSEVQKYRNRALPPCPPMDMDEFRIDLDYYAHGYGRI